MARRLTEREFVDRTLVRWKQKLNLLEPAGAVRRVASRDAELVQFVYDEMIAEIYRVNVPDASEEERQKEKKK